MQGVWWDLFWALVGGGALTTGIVGLIKGGELPMVRVPDALKPAAKFVFTLTILVGMTLLLAKGTPDLMERVVAAIVG